MPPKGPSRGGPPKVEAHSSSGVPGKGAPGGPPGAPESPELDDAALERLQQQMLEDDDFAEDMRALLLARFRAKHRKSGGPPGAPGAPSTFGGGPPGDVGFGDGGEASSEDNCSSSEEDIESEPDPEDIKRLKELGYELQPHERLLSRGKGTLKRGQGAPLGALLGAPQGPPYLVPMSSGTNRGFGVCLYTSSAAAQQ